MGKKWKDGGRSYEARGVLAGAPEAPPKPKSAEIQEQIFLMLRPQTCQLVRDALLDWRPGRLHDVPEPVRIEYDTLIGELEARLQHVVAGMPERLRT